MQSTSGMPLDQAHGLRRLFAQPRLRLLPVVANPHLAFASVVLERLCSALAGQGARTLVVDASDTAPPADGLAMMDLAQCMAPLSASVSYLAARGLPLRYVDSHGSTAPFLQAVLAAAPQVEVVLVHAGASELWRMFARQALATPLRPLLLAEDHPTSVTHAYAGMKLLALRAQLRVFDLLLCAAASSPRAPRIAEQLATCADTFLGALLHDWALVDPACRAQDAPPAGLQRIAHALLAPPAFDPTPAPRAANLSALALN